MGVETILLGKGIIIPISTFVRKYLAEINEKWKPDCNEEELIDEIMAQELGHDFKSIILGHDALNGLNCLESNDGLKQLKELIKPEQTLSKDHLPFTDVWGRDLMFIGKFEELVTESLAEFSGTIKAPEVIYGLAGLMESIMDSYPRIKQVDCGLIAETFNLTPEIWTFAYDCCCCS